MSVGEGASTVAGLPRGRAVVFIVFFGIVSLFGDMTYEGARSIGGPFLGLLGVGAATIGIVVGVRRARRLCRAPRLGLARRSHRTVLGDHDRRLPRQSAGGTAPGAGGELADGRRADRRRALGRGIRSPVRDAMLAHAGSQTGLGWGFGLHQALDQTGAVLGPLVVSAVLFLGGDYRTGFAVLVVPALLSIATLLLARLQFPRPSDFDLAPPALEAGGLATGFWVYIAAVALIAAGYADFPLIAYHFGAADIMPAAWIPILYAIAMAVDGAAGLALGTLFDRIGIRAMVLATALSAAAAPLVFLGGFGLAVVGMACWGIGTGAQESVMRATVAQLAPRDRRATAFGLFNAVYGVAWFAGSVLLGVLYDFSIVGVAVVSAALQVAALPVLLRLGRSQPQ